MSFTTLPLTTFKLIILGCALCIASIISSCKKNQQTTNNQAITEDEAVEVISQSLNPATGGFVLQTSAAASISVASASPSSCGVRKDTTITVAFEGERRSFSYKLNWSRQLSCTSGTPSSLSHIFTGSTNYTTPKISAVDNASGTFGLTGLGTSNTQLTLNQTYTRNGTQQTRVGQEHTITSKLTIQAQNIKVDKLTKQIVSGAGSVSLSGTASTGGSFSYMADIIFNGNNTATVIISGGAEHTVEW